MSANGDDMASESFDDRSTRDGGAPGPGHRPDREAAAGSSAEGPLHEAVAEELHLPPPVDASGDAPAEAPVVERGDEAVPHAGPDELFEPADLPPLRAALEAVLLVTDEPVPAVTLAQVVERPTDEVEAVLAELAQDYVDTGRGFELRTVAGGWRLYTRADCAPYVERFVLDGQQARLTQAALETLAVIAYRQPVSKARVSAVRGVNVDGVVRTLVARGLVVEAGQDGDTGGTLFRTTNVLLEKLGLQSLDDLPSLAPLLPELADIEFDSTST